MTAPTTGLPSGGWAQPRETIGGSRPPLGARAVEVPPRGYAGSGPLILRVQVETVRTISNDDEKEIQPGGEGTRRGSWSDGNVFIGALPDTGRRVLSA